MRLWSRNPKVASLALVVAVAATGCVIDARGGHDHDHGWNEKPTDTLTDPEQVAIDADALLEAEPGDGIGVMVEYGTGGHWHVFTTCDYNTPANPGVPCAFDIFATALGRTTIENASGEDLAGNDSIKLDAEGTLHLYTENTLGLNGMSFDAAPGAVVELEVYLDGQPDPHFIYWVGKDVLHTGAPSNPVRFEPIEEPVEEPPAPAQDNPPAP
jgi:hypothetical protein